jgi:hypothetical protein
MQMYQVDFSPAQLSPLSVTDGVRVHTQPVPHVSVGDASAPETGIRIPLTSRLAASLDPTSPLIGRAKAYRDPKTGRIVLGIEQDKDEHDTRALVLLSASSGFPNGISVLCQKGLALLAEGAAGHARQLLLIWPDGSEVIVEDSLREERYTLRRTGDQFDPVRLQ